MRYLVSAILLAVAPAETPYMKMKILEGTVDPKAMYACGLVGDVFTCMTFKHYAKALAEAEDSEKRRMDL